MLLDMNRTMHEAMELMRTGDLHAATRAIQRGLGAGAPGAGGASEPTTPAVLRAVGPDVIDAPYRVVPDASPAIEPANPDAIRRDARNAHDGQAGEFHEHRFLCEAGAVRYKLFIPAGRGDAAPPLIVMLHGCTQSPDDFARGTRMNALAQENGYVIAYPAQSKRRNASRCWNWFRSGDQQRGYGEAALLAALTTHLVKTYGLDPRRVYVAGLSAGGAMAAVLADAYPEVYAAIGVHSGLPVGAAHDLPSAFAAMAQGGIRSTIRAARDRAPAVPAIVFHGDRDATVDPCNGAAVVSQSTGTDTPAAQDAPEANASSEHGSVPGGRSFTRTIYRNAAGNVLAEQWVVHGGGHAWFGGDGAASYTDPSGPDASEQMLRFFSECARAAVNEPA
jgi:poly(hydroxyalkanoate) depolymerase family esterase